MLGLTEIDGKKISELVKQGKISKEKLNQQRLADKYDYQNFDLDIANMDEPLALNTYYYILLNMIASSSTSWFVVHLLRIEMNYISTHHKLQNFHLTRHDANHPL